MRVVFLLSQRPGFTADGAAELTTSSGSAPSSSAFNIFEQPMSKLVSTKRVSQWKVRITQHTRSSNNHNSVIARICQASYQNIQNYQTMQT